MRRGLNSLFLTVPKCGFLPGNEKILALLALVKPVVWTLKEKCILVSLGTGGHRKDKQGQALEIQVLHSGTYSQNRKLPSVFVFRYLLFITMVITSPNQMVLYPPP